MTPAQRARRRAENDARSFARTFARVVRSEWPQQRYELPSSHPLGGRSGACHDSIVPVPSELQRVAMMMREVNASHATWDAGGALTSLTLDPLPPPKDETQSVTTQQSPPTPDEERRMRMSQRDTAFAASGGVRPRVGATQR